ncbi:MAG: anhydro-N-acetylmuramic acid kinase, partial [Planctomycetes bacterium]|nr:anhydro-N-acetylmuramic acid kinase [Planctomycetota bacterium]
MSGTSCDGVDAALVEIDGSGLEMRVEFIAHRHVDYAEPFRNALLAVMAPAKTRTEDLAGLNVQLGEEFAMCARQLMEQADVRADQLAAIGSHGQTICHMPDGDDHHPRCTYQIGESAIIAAQTGATVVADFRAADLAVGGQGAPLVPWTDYVLFRSDDQARIVQNIGGIANLTYLPTGQGAEDTIAFDTGPGCMVIDTIIRRLTQRKHRYDPQGLYASRGQADMSCVEKMMQLPFFQQPPPKSAGREQFGRSFVSGMRQLVSGRGLDKYDMLATGTMLTARSIAYAYKTHLGIDLDDVEVQALLARFELGLKPVPASTAIPGSYWGDSEAGLGASDLYTRGDTPVHSVLHETGHFVCMTPARRKRLFRDAGGDDAEENAVCYLQVLLSEQ